MAEALGSIGEPGKRIYSVSELNETARGILEESFEDVWIQARALDVREESAAFNGRDKGCTPGRTRCRKGRRAVGLPGCEVVLSCVHH